MKKKKFFTIFLSKSNIFLKLKFDDNVFMIQNLNNP